MQFNNYIAGLVLAATAAQATLPIAIPSGLPTLPNLPAVGSLPDLSTVTKPLGLPTLAKDSLPALPNLPVPSLPNLPAIPTLLSTVTKPLGLNLPVREVKIFGPPEGADAEGVITLDTTEDASLAARGLLETRKDKQCASGACTCNYSDGTRCSTLVNEGWKCACDWWRGTAYRTSRQCVSVPTAVGRFQCD